MLPLALIAAMVIGVPLDNFEQWMFALIVMVGAAVMKRWKGRKGSMALGLLAVLVCTRYMFWRTTQTLSFGTLPEFLFGGGLYLAELYAWLILALGFVQTSFPLDRSVLEPNGEPDTWPIVDIYVPTYNESLAILRNTIFAAMEIDYPGDKHNVFILDDGKRPEFHAFAKEVGCGYITRDNNLHAKAGNLNVAMKKTDGELIAIFDCDHVPRPRCQHRSLKMATTSRSTCRSSSPASRMAARCRPRPAWRHGWVPRQLSRLCLPTDVRTSAHRQRES